MSDALRRELMLFGIDVVMIEPGTVNTSMYDKGEKEDLSEFKPVSYTHLDVYKRQGFCRAGIKRSRL